MESGGVIYDIIIIIILLMLTVLGVIKNECDFS